MQTVFDDTEGHLWVGGSSTIPEGARFYTMREGLILPVYAPAALNRDPSAIYQDPQGRLWIGTQGGLICCSNDAWQVNTNPAGLAWCSNSACKVYTTRDGLSSDSIRAIAADRTGNLWIGTERGGLNRLRDGQFTVFRKGAEGNLPVCGPG